MISIIIEVSMRNPHTEPEPKYKSLIHFESFTDLLFCFPHTLDSYH